jgi:hypothetical protein
VRRQSPALPPEVTLDRFVPADAPD